MNQYHMTYFRTLTQEQGDISLEKYLSLITGDFLASRIEEIRRLERDNRNKEAEQLKKALPAVTVAASFKGGRKKEYFRALTGLTVLDFDGLSAPDLEALKRNMQADPHVLLCNVSVRGHGLKVIVAYHPEDDRMPTGWESCKSFYSVAYTTIAAYFQHTYGCAIDTSGKDMPRLNFLSCDAEAYFNADATPFVVPAATATAARVAPPSPVASPDAAERKPAATGKKKIKKSLIPFIGDESISYERRKLLLEIVYRNLYRSKHYYVVGNRHKFLLLATYQFNEYGIPQHETERLILQSEPLLQNFEENAVLKDPDEIRKLVRDIYTTERAQFGKERINSDLRNQIYMKIEIARLYRLRFNQLSERIEYIEHKQYDAGERIFQELKDRIITDLHVAATEMGLGMEVKEIRTIFESSFAKTFDPVLNYMDECPEWDGHDHIADLADSIVVNDPARFRKILTMWYVGMVQSYLHDNIVNHIMIVLFTGSQGEGKTRAISKMLPQEMSHHLFIPKRLQITKEEFGNYIAHKLVIFVDEMQKLDKNDKDSLQGDVTIPKIDFRQPYGHYSHNHCHCASFIGACNSTKFMDGPEGNRRYHVFEASKFVPFTPNYRQMFAQIKHLIAAGFKYYFTPDEQDELAAYARSFESNSDEYEMVLKYIRIYPDDYADKTKYRVAEILQAFKRLSPHIATDKSAIVLLTKALKRRKIPFESHHNGSNFCCYVLTAEQAEYIEQQRDSTQVLDLEYDKYVPQEVLWAHREATIRDLCKANEILIHSDGNFEKAKQMYNDYLAYEKGNFTTENDLTIF